MRGQTTSVVLGFKRLLAVLAAFSILMTMMAIYAQPALAHHPILDVDAYCNDEGDIEVIWSLSNGDWEGKPMTVDMVSYTGGEAVLDTIEVGLTLYADEETSDTVVYDGSESGLKTLEVRADWEYGSQDVTRSASIDLSEYDCEPQYEPVTVVVGHGSCDGSTNLGWAFVAIDPDLAATVHIVGPGGPYAISSDTNLELAPGDYSWSAAPDQGFVVQGDSEGEFEILPCEAAVLVSHGDCAYDQALSSGFVDVEIDPDSGATVVVDGPGGPYAFDGSGGVHGLEPGNYSWNALPAAGYQIVGESSGYFSIEPCEASVVVGHGDCAVDETVESGYVQVAINPEDAASVVVSGGDGPHQFTGSGGTLALAPGDYTWTATAAGDFELQGDTAGEFSIVDCGEIIVNKEISGDSVGDDRFEISVAQGDLVVWTGELGDGGTSGVIPVNPGVYVASELLPDGWKLADLDCDDGDASRGDGSFMTIDVGPGETVTCTFFNEENRQDPPDTEVKDEVVEADDEVEDVEVLPFTGPNTATLSVISFALLVAGVTLVHHARRREEGDAL